MSPMLKAFFTLEYALLGFFRQQPRHGYEVYQLLSNPAGLWQVWRVKQSQLYALLAKLEAEGYLSASLHPQDARPPRKVFTLTAAGRDAFLTWVQSPVAQPRQIRIEFLSKLYFARQEGAAVVQQLLTQQCAVCHAWVATQQAQADTITDPHAFPWLVNQFRLTQVEAILDWLLICEQIEAPAQL